MKEAPYTVGYDNKSLKYFVEGPNSGEFRFFGNYSHLQFDTLKECSMAVDVANIAFKYGIREAQINIKKALNII